MRKLWISFVVAAVALAAGVLWLVATPQGLKWVIQLVTTHLEIDFKTDEVQGRLLGPATLRNIRYRDRDGNTMAVSRLELDWRPQALFDKTLHVRRLMVQQVVVQQGPAAASDTTAVSMPEVRLPVAIAIDDAHINDLRFSRAGRQEPLAVESVRLRGRADRDGIVIEVLEVHAQDFELRTAGQITPRGDYPLNVTIDWSVQHPMIAVPLKGRSALQGTLNQLETNSVFETPAAARLSLEIANVFSHPRWQGQLHTERINLQGLNEGWPQWKVSGELQATGDLETATVAGNIKSEHADWGVLSSALDVHWVPPGLHINRVDVTRSGSPASLTATGRVALGKTPVVSFDLNGEWRDIAYPWQGPAEWVTPEGRFVAKGDVDSFVVRVDGMVSASGSQPDELTHIAQKMMLEAAVEDLRGKPGIKAKVDVPYLRIAEYTANDLRVDIDLDTTDTRPSHIDVSIAGFQYQKQAITDVQLRGTGRISQHTLEIVAKQQESRLHIAGSGGWQDPNWTVALDRFDLHDVLSTDWLLSSGEVRLTVAQTHAALQRACWRIFEGSVCVAGHWETGAGWRADLDVDGLSVPAIGALWRPEVTWTGVVSGRARVGAGADKVLSATAHLGSGEGSATLAAEDKPLVLSYRDIRIDAKIENDQLRGDVRGTINDHGALRGTITVGKLFHDTAIRPIEGDLNAQLTTLDPIRAVFPELGVEGGEMDARLKLRGDLTQPVVTAVARVSNATVAVPQAGTRLESINIKLESKDDATINWAGDARSGDGSLTVTGTSQFFDRQNWNFELKIGGAGVQALNLPEAKVVATPDLELKMRPGRIDLGGVVNIVEATIMPELVAGAGVTLSRDVVIVDEDTELSAAVLDTHARIKIALGDDVNFSGYGLTGKLRGSVDVVQEPSRATLATGEINILDGVYSVYGRTLDITTGRLTFAGGAIDNPGIDVSAVRKINDVTVTASLRGTLQQPELSLTSEPAMSDTDMLSYLVLSRPANQIGGGDATLLLNAASTLLPKAGGIGVTERIKSAFGLETLAVETRQDAEQETRETSLVLGRYLTPRLYIAYAAGVANTLNVFRVRYELSKRWLLQTESSSRQSGGDILFKVDR